MASRATTEPLHPELTEYLREHDGIVDIKHPLVNVIAFDPKLNGYANGMLEQKQRALKDAKAEGDWVRVLMLYEKPWRINIFANELMYELDDADYWEELRNLWVHCENIWETEKLWLLLLQADRPERQHLLTADDHQELDELPAELTVYRGFNRTERERGCSWTLDRERGIWFARRYAQYPPKLTLAIVGKGDVLAYFTEANESEIVVNPATLHVANVELVA